MPLWPLFLALAGCSAPDPGRVHRTKIKLPPRTDRYTVTVARAPFYRFGPAQTQGADFSLHKGDDVTVLSREAGFSRVRSDHNGMEGYVAADLLAPLPPVAAAPARKPARRRAKSADQPHPFDRLQVVPIDQMFEEPPLPTGGGPALPKP